MDISINLAKEADFERIRTYDRHVAADVLAAKIAGGEVYVAYDGDRFAGWLRYNLFWDNTPFMNMLYLLEDYRARGIGRLFVERWEQDMTQQGFKELMTSSQQNEHAQHFYLKMGYKAVGGFMQADGEYELLFAKYFP